MSVPTDHDLDLSVASMLRFGVSLAALVVLIGGVLYLRHPFAPIPDYKQFVAGGPELRTLSGIYDGVKRLNARSIIQLGLVLLIATPVARVVFCVIGFSRQHKPLYIVVSLIVLAVLIYSFTNGAV
ncbi:MAG: DUF1634 domain-containing protein [Acidobacteria bacterium]|nr:DUF1634 domain-containing protein [Acidobacteriota bacterium]